MSILPGGLGGLGGHLGTRVSALLDGQLGEAESAKAWAHLAGCRTCQQEVERESWIKRRVAGLSYDAFSAEAPSSLKGELLGAPRLGCGLPAPQEQRRAIGLALVGGGALGAAVMGFVAFGAAPADAPTSPQPQLVSYTSQLGQPAPAPAIFRARP